jgi:hypothetical protein
MGAPPTVHVVTVHFQSDRWIDIQLLHLAANLHLPMRTYGSLDGIDPVHRAKFDYGTALEGKHFQKLNQLAEIVVAEAKPTDVILFLDGDAFPIAPIDDLIVRSLDEYGLVAVRRAENGGDPQPHPCFAFTTVGLWRDIGGDWSHGEETWRNDRGLLLRDVGGHLLAQLRENDIRWLPLLRTNHTNLHPLFFAVYGDVAYHHGAGFRQPRTRADYSGFTAAMYRLRRSQAAGRLGRAIGKRALSRGLRDSQDRNQRLSDEVYEVIRSDPGFVQMFLT